MLGLAAGELCPPEGSVAKGEASPGAESTPRALLPLLRPVEGSREDDGCCRCALSSGSSKGEGATPRGICTELFALASAGGGAPAADPGRPLRLLVSRDSGEVSMLMMPVLWGSRGLVVERLESVDGLAAAEKPANPVRRKKREAVGRPRGRWPPRPDASNPSTLHLRVPPLGIGDYTLSDCLVLFQSGEVAHDRFGHWHDAHGVPPWLCSCSQWAPKSRCGKRRCIDAAVIMQTHRHGWRHTPASLMSGGGVSACSPALRLLMHQNTASASRSKPAIAPTTIPTTAPVEMPPPPALMMMLMPAVE